MANGSAALYQVALALIPAILFGGATLEVRRGSGPNNRLLLGLILAVVLGIGVLAEMTAIRGAIEPNQAVKSQRFLAIVMVVGTVALALWIAAPLFLDPNGKSVPLGLTLPLVCAILAVAGYAGYHSIGKSLDQASAHSAYKNAAKRRLAANRDLHLAEGQDFAARGHLVAIAGSIHGSGTPVPFVLVELGRLEQNAFGKVRRGLTTTNVEARVEHAHAVLHRVDARLRRDFRHELPEMRRIEYKLLLLAERRMVSAAAVVMTTAVERTKALQTIQGICAREHAPHECATASV